MSLCSRIVRCFRIRHLACKSTGLKLFTGSMNFQALIRNHINRIDLNTFYDRILYSYPSNDQLMHMFLSYFNGMEHAYKKTNGIYTIQF